MDTHHDTDENLSYEGTVASEIAETKKLIVEALHLAYQQLSLPELAPASTYRRHGDHVWEVLERIVSTEPGYVGFNVPTADGVQIDQRFETDEEVRERLRIAGPARRVIRGVRLFPTLFRVACDDLSEDALNRFERVFTRWFVVPQAREYLARLDWGGSEDPVELKNVGLGLSSHLSLASEGWLGSVLGLEPWLQSLPRVDTPDAKSWSREAVSRMPSLETSLAAPLQFDPPTCVFPGPVEDERDRLLGMWAIWEHAWSLSVSSRCDLDSETSNERERLDRLRHDGVSIRDFLTIPHGAGTADDPDLWSGHPVPGFTGVVDDKTLPCWMRVCIDEKLLQVLDDGSGLAWTGTIGQLKFLKRQFNVAPTFERLVEMVPTLRRRNGSYDSLRADQVRTARDVTDDNGRFSRSLINGLRGCNSDS